MEQAKELSVCPYLIYQVYMVIMLWFGQLADDGNVFVIYGGI